MAITMCVVVVFVLASVLAQAAATKSLGHKKSRRLMMKDPSSMLTELEGMVRSGETPAFDLVAMIKSIIQDEIMPGVQSTRDAAAQRTTDALNAIQLCNNESKTRADDIEGSTQVSVENARSLHAGCRDVQKTMYYHNLTHADSYCVKLGEFLHDATSVHIPGGSTRDEAVAYVKYASNTNMCGRSEVTELADNCTATETELSNKKADCLAKQGSFEEAFCTWKTELELNCKALDTCHSMTVTAYNNHVAKTKALVEKWDIETAALHKILCFCNVWLSEEDEGDNRSQHNATQFDVCKAQTYTAIAVDYGMPATKVACPLTSVANCPGTPGFITQEYGSFLDFFEPVIPCAQATTAAPTTVAPMHGDTILTANVSAGSTEIEVNDQTGFFLGQTVDIDPGTEVHETNTIKEFGSIIFKTPLQFDHPGGARVVGQAPAAAPTTAAPTTTQASPTTETTGAPTQKAPTTEQPQPSTPAPGQTQCTPSNCDAGLTCKSSPDTCCNSGDWECCGTDAQKFGNRLYCPALLFTCNDGFCGVQFSDCANHGGVRFSDTKCQADTPAPPASPEVPGCTHTDGGALDVDQEGCDVYERHAWACGQFDDDDFKAAEMCCTCGGGSNSMFTTQAPTPMACTNTDNGALDSVSDDCAGYEGFGWACGQFDDTDFNSADMCCACGGGNKALATETPTTEAPTTTTEAVACGSKYGLSQSLGNPIAMKSAGWDFGRVQNWDMTNGYIGGLCRTGSNWYGWTNGNAPGTISTILSGSGTATLQFGNCYYQGRVNVYVNGVRRATAWPRQPPQTFGFSFTDGTTLALTEEMGNGVIQLNAITFSC